MLAGVVHAAAVAEGFEEAAVAGVAGIAAGQLVAQAGLLVGDTAAGRSRASPLQLHCISHVLWVLQKKKTKNITRHSTAADVQISASSQFRIKNKIHIGPKNFFFYNRMTLQMVSLNNGLVDPIVPVMAERTFSNLLYNFHSKNVYCHCIQLHKYVVSAL